MPSSTVAPTGTWLWRLEPGNTWTNVLQLSSDTDTHADAKVVGSVTHILLYRGSTASLVSIEYVPASSNYQLWAMRPTTTVISLPGSETATIDIDSTSRMWLTTESSVGIDEYYSAAPYSAFRGP